MILSFFSTLYSHSDSATPGTIGQDLFHPPSAVVPEHTSVSDIRQKALALNAIRQSIYPSIFPPIYPLIHQSINTSVHQSTNPSSHRPTDPTIPQSPQPLNHHSIHLEPFNHSATQAINPSILETHQSIIPTLHRQIIRLLHHAIKSSFFKIYLSVQDNYSTSAKRSRPSGTLVNFRTLL